MNKELEELKVVLKTNPGTKRYFDIFETNLIAPIETALKALEIIKKYTYSGGWSGDYTTEYWNMSQEEIKIIDEMFVGVLVKPLSERNIK